MVSSLYVAASGMISEERRLSIISNNLANVDAQGFKRDRITFSNYLYHTGLIVGSPKKKVNYPDQNYFDPQNSVVFTDEHYIDFSPGPVKETEKPTSVAIDGRGFFVVRKDGRTLYTRNGNFVVDASGVLKTVDGAEVLGRVAPNMPLEPVVVEPGQDVVIREDGAVLQNGNPLFYLEVRDFNGDYNAYLKKYGHTYFELKDPKNRGFRVQEPKLLTGYVETANANVVEEMVRLINCIRHYEACQKAVQITFEDVTSRSVNDVGRIA